MSPILILPSDRPPNPTPFHNAVLADNPTVYFRMDDAGAPLTDEQSCANTSTAWGSLAFQQPGKFGFAVESFPNAGTGDYILTAAGTTFPNNTGGCTCPSSAPNTITTLEAIIKRNGTPSLGDEYFMCNYQNIALGVQTGTGFLQCLFERSTAGGPYQTITTSLNVCDGAWHHIVVTVNSTNWQFYVDNVNQAPATGLNPPNTSFNGTCVGLFCRVAKGGNPAPVESDVFIGQISMAAWYRQVALTAPQVATHYAAYQLI